MSKVNLDKYIWEDQTVRHFIEELEPILNMIMSGNSFIKPIDSREKLAQWCADNQPYYKKVIPDVVNYFF